MKESTHYNTSSIPVMLDVLQDFNIWGNEDEVINAGTKLLFSHVHRSSGIALPGEIDGYNYRIVTEHTHYDPNATCEMYLTDIAKLISEGIIQITPNVIFMDDIDIYTGFRYDQEVN